MSNTESHTITTLRLKGECLWNNGFHEDVWFLTSAVLLTITFGIGVPVSPVVEIHVNICEEIWRAAGQRTEHFVLVQTRFLFNTTLKTKASQTHATSQPESVLLNKCCYMWMTDVMFYMSCTRWETDPIVHENRISWMNPSWLHLLVGFACKSLKHLDFLWVILVISSTLSQIML